MNNSTRFKNRKIILFLSILFINLNIGLCEMVARCPMYWKHPIGSPDCYKIHNYGETRTWEEAVAYCNRYNSKLVSIMSKEFKTWLGLALGGSDGLGGSHAWTSATKKDGSWIWSENNKPVDTDIINFSGADDDMHTCGALDAGDKLNRHKCSDELHFVCHRDINEPSNCDRDHGWEFISNHCYKPSTKPMSWHDSQFECSLEYGHVVWIDDATENQYVHDVAYKTGSDLWLGMNEEGHPGIFNWTDNLDRKYTNWNNESETHQPESMHGAAAAVMLRGDHDGRWITERMNVDRSYLCEKWRGSCLTDWTQHGDTCYFMNTEKIDKVVYSDAKDRCANVGARIPVINDDSEDEFFKNHLPGEGYYWLGLQKLKGGNFKWVDDSAFDQKNYTKMSDEDYNAAMSEDADKCVYIKETEDGTAAWIPTDCNEQQYFACEANIGDKINMTIPSGEIFCPDQYIQRGEYCYQFNEDEVTWEGARSNCKADGANLASILSWDESDFITDNLVSEAWIGLNDRNNADHWVWDDGSKIRINNWAEGEPNGEQESCVHLYLSGEWNDHFCDSVKGYICKSPASSEPIKPAPTTTTPLTEGGCGYGWKENPYTGECYKFEDRTFTFADAETHCNQHDRGSDDRRPTLVTINSPEEQEILMDLLKESRETPSIWIGLKNDYYDGLFWVDESPVQFLNWADGEPNLGVSEDVIELYTDSGLWNDADGSIRLRFVCERKGTNYIIPTQPPPTESTCPNGWIRHDSYCYYYSANPKSLKFGDAQNDCQSKYGSNLVSITSEDENSWIFDTFSVDKTNLYIGLTQAGTGDDWTWLDGSPTNYFNWYTGEPNNDNGDEHCGEMLTSGYYDDATWNDRPCSYGGDGYICKMLVRLCPDGFSFDDGKCFYISNFDTDWSSAKDKCKEFDENDDLVSIHSEEENNFINGLVAQYGTTTAWTGLHYVNTQDQNWTWTDGSDFDYINWHDGEPNYLDTEQCMELINDPNRNDWNNRDCDQKREFVCQYSPSHYIGCPVDWIEYDSSCYYFSVNSYTEELRTFYESETYCQSLGGHLTSITSAEENDFLFSYLQFSYVDAYIGLSDNNRKGSLKWTDESPVIFTKLATAGEYGNFEPSCGMFSYTYNPLWYLSSCDTPDNFICEKPKEPVAITPPPAEGCLDGDLVYEGSCYQIGDTSYSWTYAQSMCETYTTSGSLVVINNRYEQAFISAHIDEAGERVWIGLKMEVDDDGTYNSHWVNGEDVTYTNWGQYEPRAGQGLCAESSGREDDPGLWYITKCNYTRTYICEYPRDGFIPPTTTPTPPPPVLCADGWTRNDQEHVCYKVFNQKEVWGYAEDLCSSYGGGIMSWSNEAEQQVTKTLPDFNLTATNAWLGFRLGADGGYYWTDNTPFEFWDWDSGQPDSLNHRESCGAMVVDSLKMSDYVCDDLLPFVCEVKEGSMVTTAPPPTHSPDVACPSDKDWLLYGDYCYLFVSESDDEKQSWWHSRRLCEEKSGKLASIHSYEENYWILSKIYEKSDSLYWIGAQADYNSSWNSWEDNTPFDFTNWASGEPNNYHDQEDCIGMYAKKGGYWNDANCNMKYGRICKKGYLVTFPPGSTPSPPEGHCPEGWFHSVGKCIKLFGKSSGARLNYTSARSSCKSQGKNGDLLSIHSSLQQATLTAVFGMDWKVDVWIGLKKEGGTFRWIDQSEMDFMNWAPGEPNNQNNGNEKEDCVQVYHISGLWNDKGCSANIGYACEMDVDPSIGDHHPLPNCAAPYDSYYQYRDDCYMHKSEALAWQDAETECKKDGGHLASAQDLFETSYLWVLGKTETDSSFYIGLNNLHNPNQFVWEDGWPVLYTNWGHMQPNINITTNNCVVVNDTNGEWFSQDCSVKRPYVCKYHNGTVPTPEPPVDGSCPGVNWQDFTGNYCYLFRTDIPATWGDANAQCIQDGGHLVSIHSEAEKELIVKSAGNSAGNYWIGLIYQSVDFSWSDGTSFDYTLWNDGEPNDRKEKCVEMLQSSGKWNDQLCSTKRKFICKAPKVLTYTKTPEPTIKTEGPHLTTPGRATNDLGGGAIFGIIAAVLLAFAAVGFIGFRQYQKPKKIDSGPAGVDNTFYKPHANDPNPEDNKITVQNIEFGVTDA